MLEQIRTALADAAQGYSDTRFHYCWMEATALKGNHCTLSGTVLDVETRATMTAALAGSFPKITFDAATVRVLRSSPAQLLTVVTNVAGLYAEPSLQAEMVSQLLNGWRVERLQGEGRWVYLRQADGYLGWAYLSYLAGTAAPAPTHIACTPVSLLRQEETARRQQMVRDVAQFIGVPYVWGGCTGLGIDCSGMIQLLHRLVGRTIPRDAETQYTAGRPVEPPFRQGDLLFFGGESDTRAITHVGMSLGGWRMVHASIARNGVYEADVQAVGHLRERFAGARTFLSR